MAHRIAELKAELIAGHPDTGPYSLNDATAADEINVVNRTKPKPSLTGDEVFGATDGAEFIGLSDHQQILWLSFCGRPQIDPFQSANVDLVKHLFGAGSATVTALVALRSKAVSRAEELGLHRVREGTVTEARAS